MTKANGGIGGHLSMLTEDAGEWSFLKSIPWILDAHLQSPDMLVKTLHSESSRLRELVHQPTFSLLTVLRDTPPRHLASLSVVSLPIVSKLAIVPGRRREHVARAYGDCPRSG